MTLPTQAGYSQTRRFAVENRSALSVLRMSAPGHSAIRLSAQAKRKNTRARPG
jgi:hypothetical protein